MSKHQLTNKQKEIIRRHYFGPYDQSWFDSKGLLNNGDSDISKRIKAPIQAVTRYATKIIEEHFKKI